MGTGETFVLFGWDFMTGWRRRDNGPEICEFSVELQCVFNTQSCPANKTLVQVPVTVHREQSVKREKTNKIRCLLSTSVSTCFGHHCDHLKENKDRVLLHMVYCSGSGGCGWQRLWGAALQDASSARILQRSAPQPLPTTSSRTRTIHQMQ